MCRTSAKGKQRCQGGGGEQPHGGGGGGAGHPPDPPLQSIVHSSRQGARARLQELLHVRLLLLQRCDLLAAQHALVHL